MAGSKLAIKSRIKSVDSTMKITKAMQLVAASKYQRQKDRMQKNKEYAIYLKEVLEQVLANVEQKKGEVNEKTCTIVFTSDMGLCGGYNSNVYRLIESQIQPDDDLIMIGSRGITWAKHRNYSLIKTLAQVEDDQYSLIAALADECLGMVEDGCYGKIRVIYTEFVNPLRFEPRLVNLYPFDPVESKLARVETIYEPGEEEILKDLVPMAVKSMLYSYWLETKTSEQASRRTSMETATDNAEELKATLELEYNQARQAAITQEITEIVGGANAL